MRKHVDEWIARQGPFLKADSESEEEAKKRKREERKAILRGDLIIGKGAKKIFDEQMRASLAEAKLKHSQKKLSRGQTRDRGFSKKEVAFVHWTKQYKIDLNESLDSVLDKLERAYEDGEIKEKISRSTLDKYLDKYRAKKD